MIARRSAASVRWSFGAVLLAAAALNGPGPRVARADADVHEDGMVEEEDVEAVRRAFGTRE